MYNTDIPRRAELPTSAQLTRSTLIAMASAAVILVTIVLPSEYAVDPTGVGRMFGLTQMGEIKAQLAGEAEADAIAMEAASRPAVSLSEAGQQQTSNEEMAQRIDQLEALIRQQQAPQQAAPQMPPPLAQQEEAVQAPPAAIAAVPAEPAPVEAPQGRSDSGSFVLTPGQGIEIKLVMQQGARANFSWSSVGGPVNFDAHGDGGGQSISYEKGRGVETDQGVLEAAFDGNHGWFWRNRGKQNVTMSLQVSGDYSAIKGLP